MPTRVRAGAKYTVNLGDYNSVSFDFSVEDDVREGETTSKALDRCYDMVLSKLTPRVEEARKHSVA